MWYNTRQFVNERTARWASFLDELGIQYTYSHWLGTSDLKEYNDLFFLIDFRLIVATVSRYSENNKKRATIVAKRTNHPVLTVQNCQPIIEKSRILPNGHILPYWKNPGYIINANDEPNQGLMTEFACCYECNLVYVWHLNQCKHQKNMINNKIHPRLTAAYLYANLP